jgi:hypothetical protein
VACVIQIFAWRAAARRHFVKVLQGWDSAYFSIDDGLDQCSSTNLAIRGNLFQGTKGFDIVPPISQLLTFSLWDTF